MEKPGEILHIGWKSVGSKRLTLCSAFYMYKYILKCMEF